MTNTPGILIIDDEQPVGTFFGRLLKGKGYRIGIASSGAQAHELIDRESFNVAMVDLKLPDADGLSLLQHIKAEQPQCEVIIMTGYSTTRTAVKAMQYGAFDYIEKPFDDIALVEELIEKALKFSKSPVEMGTDSYEWSSVAERIGFQVGKTPQMTRLVSIAERIATKDINVLIHGETGTGKEVLARFVHAASHRSERPFLAINCGALPENLLESELFGHERGSFTGASAQRKGIFELAHNGTLFLDEVGEASLAIQVKLLRVLETGEFLRVGGEKPVQTNVRIIAATNVDLEDAVSQKTFREDLFYRLDVIRLVLPPLRERKEDIPQFIEHFIRKFWDERSGLPPTFAPTSVGTMQHYHWPGNIRELANVVEQALALCDQDIILPEHLSDKIKGPTKGIAQVTEKPMEAKGNLLNFDFRTEDLATMEEESLLRLYRDVDLFYKTLNHVIGKRGIAHTFPVSMEEIEARAIAETLEFYHGNVSMTAKALGIGRNTLYRKAKEYKINITG